MTEERTNPALTPAAPALDEPIFYEEIDPADLEPQPFAPPNRRRVLIVIALFSILLALALGPPLINVSRYRREITASISASLGRPVHLDSVSLNLLPVPSFTLENFVVTEDPVFGAEPVLRASSVRAALRLSSLWRHKVEFSTITLEDPSVNLVHLPDGRWNLEAILLQASRVPTAPTVQKSASENPRFPYIEATGARVNLKQGNIKQPLSLTDARFSLWLPEPNQWRLRLEGHPNRTDVPATDTGRFRLEGTLGRAASLETVPVDLDATWSAAPLGGVSWVMLGRDLGIRGDLTASVQVNGTVGANAIETRLELHSVRRADFVPAHDLDANIGCRAQALDDLHRLDAISCHWPRLSGPEPAGSKPLTPGLSLTGSLPELMHPSTVQLNALWNGIPASLLLDVLRAASPRIAPTLQASGTLSGQAICCADAQSASNDEGPLALTMTDASLTLGSDEAPILSQSISATAAGGRLLIEPLLLDLGAPTPARLNLDADWTGLHLRLSGPAQRNRLEALAAALPQFGDGLEAVLPPVIAPRPDTPLHLDAEATRPWQGGQIWQSSALSNTEPTRPKPVHRRRRGSEEAPVPSRTPRP